MVRVSASKSVDMEFISQVESYQKTLKNAVHSFSAWLSAHRDGTEENPVSLLAVSLGKILIGMPPSLCSRKVVGPSSLFVVVTQSNCRLVKKANEKLII